MNRRSIVPNVRPTCVIVLCSLLLVAAQRSQADDNAAEKLLGVWKLTASKVQIVGDKSPARDSFGPNPKGYLIFTREGRMASVLSSSGRTPPTDDTDNIALMKTLAAYTGKYVVDGDKYITHVDVSWNEIYSQQEQVRHFRIEGDMLTVSTPEAQSALLPGRRIVGWSTFERVR
jgi:hypothetical protein